jgi:thiosulfate/3-mercaptopyruvate sulfurtransferase
VSQAAVTPLVSTQWLEEHLGDPALRVLETTMELRFDGETGEAKAVSGRAAWEAGHISGSAFVDLAELSEPTRPGEFMVPPPERFEAAMSDLGVGPGNHVVVYDSGATMFATRLWWMLRLFGFDAVSVLDGGWPAWKQEGRPVSTRPCSSPRARFEACLRPHLLAALDDVEAEVASAAGCRVNALSPQMFRGEARVGYRRPGRIPGSINVPYYELLTSEGRWREPAELRERFADAGVLGATDRVVAFGLA